MNYFILTKKEKQKSGLWDLNLEAYSNGEKIGSLIVNSGSPKNQNFRTFPEQVTQELEPVPEGEYDLGSLEWSGGKGNYNSYFKDIQSPIWVTIVRSRAIGFHLDGNRSYAPGSAGCVVFKDMNDLKAFVGWYDKFGSFDKCYVDWGLSHVKIPKPVKSESSHWCYKLAIELYNEGILKGKSSGNSVYFGLDEPITYGVCLAMISAMMNNEDAVKRAIKKVKK